MFDKPEPRYGGITAFCRQGSRPLHTSFMALVTGLVLYLVTGATAFAHTDPPNANGTGASLILVALRNDGTTIIGGDETVSSCETIQFRAALQPSPDTDNPDPIPDLIGPAIEGGTWTLTTPDGTPHDITPGGGIGCIGGTANDNGVSGRGLDCEGSPAFILSDAIPYTVSGGDISGDKISASSSWENGFAHRGADDEFPVNVNTPLSIDVASCSDAFCAPEMCDPQADDGVILGQCVPDTPPDCNDGSACTTDSCNEETDSCDNIDISGQCDDQDACTADSCDPATGCVNEDISGTCDDSNACTADSCDPATGCVNEDISGTCDDGDACTADSCDPATGCVNEDISGTCDDGDACTADSCDPATGCVNEDISGTCDDGDACTADSCDPATGCVNEDISGTCDDGDACTADSCDPATGCVNEDISGTCDDGDACTADSCDPATGCVNEDISGTCDDGDACTADSCDPATGCVNEDISGTCDDSDACTADSCDPATGCVNEDISGTCDDGDACTADSCDPATGCVNEDISGTCDDGDACTADSCDPATGCVNEDISGTCDDGDACTADSCDPATGCVNEDISGTCDDGDVCTADSCDPELGCVNELLPPEDAPAECFALGCDTRTRGYWTQHEYEAEAVDWNAGGLETCGQEIATGNECPPVKGTRWKGLAGNLQAQCVAATLNFAVSGQNDGECSGQLEAALYTCDGGENAGLACGYQDAEFCGAGDCVAPEPPISAETIMGACCGAESVCTGADIEGISVSACVSVLSAFNESMDTLEEDVDFCHDIVGESGDTHFEADGNCAAYGEVCLSSGEEAEASSARGPGKKK